MEADNYDSTRKRRHFCHCCDRWLAKTTCYEHRKIFRGSAHAASEDRVSSDIDTESDFSLQSDVESICESLCEFDSMVQESETYGEEARLEGN